jgi:tetratricopeptide (TPR) repeat protein
MGVVYLAGDPNGRPVALKTIQAPHGQDPRFRERFREEVRAMRPVPRPFVARVLDADPDDDPPWLVTEYVEGPTLQESVDRDGPWSYWEVKDLALATAMGLRHMHAVGVIHRDFKPANVLLSVKTVPKVIDFGLAAAADFASPPGSRWGLGSIHYMAPEILCGDEGKQAADIFAWAGTVVFASTGRPPFGTGTIDELRERILHRQSDLDGVDTRLRPVVAAALRKDPLSRPSAQDLLQELGIVTGELEAEQRLVEASLADRRRPPEAVAERDVAPTVTVDHAASTAEVSGGDPPSPTLVSQRSRAMRWLDALDRPALPSWWYGLFTVGGLLFFLLLPWTLLVLMVASVGSVVALVSEPRLRAWLKQRRTGAPYYRALRLYRQGRRREAEKLLWDMTMQGREGWALRAAVILGNLLREQGRVGPAIEAYEEGCKLIEEQPTAGAADRELAALAALNLGHAHQAEHRGREAREAYRRVRVLAGERPTRRAQGYSRQAAEWRQELMRRSGVGDSEAAGRRHAPGTEPPAPLRYWPAVAALATAALWCALAVGGCLGATDGSSSLLRPRAAVAILLIGMAAVVLAVGARQDLERLGPLVRAPGFAPAALGLAAVGYLGSASQARSRSSRGGQSSRGCPEVRGI